MKRAGYASGRYDGRVDPDGRPGRRQRPPISEIAKTAFEALGFKVKLRLLSQQIVQTRFCGYPPRPSRSARTSAGRATSPTARPSWTRRSTASTSRRSATRTSPSSTCRPSTRRSSSAKTLTDPAARAKAWGDVDREIIAQAPAVPLVWDKVPMAHSADVNAVANENLGVWDFSYTLAAGNCTPPIHACNNSAEPGGDRPGLAIWSPARVARLARRTHQLPRRPRWTSARPTGACPAFRSRTRPMSTARCRSSSASRGSARASARRSRPPGPAATCWW